jgi:uncharacterized protein (TIGR00251 family)
LPTPPYITKTDQGVILRILVQPRASKTEFAEAMEDRLKLRISSPPVDGKANNEIIKFLSKTLRLPKNRISLIRGETSRRKDIFLASTSPAQLKLPPDVANY